MSLADTRAIRQPQELGMISYGEKVETSVYFDLGSVIRVDYGQALRETIRIVHPKDLVSSVIRIPRKIRV